MYKVISIKKGLKIKRINNLIAKNGFILFFIRLPFRIMNRILNKLTTIFWKYFIREMGDNCLIEFGVKIENPKQLILKNNVYIGKNTVFGSENTEGLCILHNNVHIGTNCKIDHTGNVIIENDVLFSSEVTIFSHSHGYDPYSIPIAKNIIIGRNSWIGYRVVILENTKAIAHNVIIASGAYVTKECSIPDSLYGGVPAIKLKHLNHKDNT